MLLIRRFAVALALVLAVATPRFALGAMTISPSPSSDGSYTVSWTEQGGPGWRLMLTLDNGLVSDVTGLQPKSMSFHGKVSGIHCYSLEVLDRYDGVHGGSDACVEVVAPPGVPGAIQGPATSQTGSYGLTWYLAAGPVTGYELYENGALVYSGSAAAASLAFRPTGSYSYQVRACNANGCGGSTAPFVVTVDLHLSLSSLVPDAPLTPVAAPAQGWAGTIPGTPSADGGAAGYRVEIEVPPGRQGVQPELALTYSSRAGNGIAGVGWSLSAPRSIYRCPRTLDQDGGNRPVWRDASDRLCMGGQRLVLASGTYGAAGSVYRTEIDQFDRIELNGADMGNLASYFVVQRKNGRLERYQAMQGNGAPGTWLQTLDWDRAGNCARYSYVAFTSRGDSGWVLNTSYEWVLDNISYTGTYTGTPGSGTCSLPATARVVQFSYTARPDNRTTFAAGAPTIQTARLSAIQTKVGATPVRRYELRYAKTSAATGRSLLTAVQVCAGATCAGAALPPTTFSYDDGVATFSSTRVADPGWTEALIGDLNGDGRRERVWTVESWPGSRTYSHFIGGSKGEWAGLDDASAKLLDGTRTYASSPYQDVDLDGDGRADFLGESDGNLKLGHLVLVAGKWTIQWTETVQIPPEVCKGTGVVDCRSHFVQVSLEDFDGDGRPDYRLRDTSSWTSTAYAFRRTNLTGLAYDYDPNIKKYSELPPNAANAADFNGDGRMDVIVATDNIASFTGFGQTWGQATAYSSLGGPAGATTSLNLRMRVDVNGDGLADIYEVGTGGLWLNVGGQAGAATRLAKVALVGAFPPGSITSYARGMDVDGDGRDEIVVPVTRAGGQQYCWKYFNTDYGEPMEYCSGEHVPGGPGLDGDKSGFRWSASRFVEQPDGSFVLQDTGIGFVAPLTFAPADLNGDGMLDIAYSMQNEYDSQGELIGWFPSAEQGAYESINTARAPDLLTSVTNGVGASASWSYQPLSSTNRNGCPQSPGALYIAHNDQAQEPGHVFFTSSMWVVSRFDVSNGLGTSQPRTNGTCYQYEDAMLNVKGRGFLGFKKIISEEQLTVAAGEVGSSALSPNNLRTTTEFSQVFPFTNRQVRVTVENIATSATLSDTSTWWVAHPSVPDSKFFMVAPAATEVRTFDPARKVPRSSLAAMNNAAVARTITINATMDLTSGETASSCTLSWDLAPGSNATMGSTTRTFSNDSTNHWLGRVESETRWTDFLTGTLPDLTALALTSTSNSSAWNTDPAASCPVVASTANRKKQARTNGWYADGVSGSARRLACQRLTVGADPSGACTASVDETRTTFTYDAYGNPYTRAIVARGVMDPAVPETLLTMATIFGTSADGYFVETEQNPLGHVSTTTHDPATGAPLTRRAVQGGPLTTLTYDSLGRLYSTRVDGGQPTYQVVAAASLLVCGPDSAAPCGWVASMRTTTQAGTPTRIEYFDLVGRVVETDVTAFGGLKRVIQQVAYNERGLTLAESAPRLEDAAAFWTTYSGFDTLGRVGRKTTVRDTSLFSTGAGGAIAVTDYSYGGVDELSNQAVPFRTAISVQGKDASSPVLKMSRTVDPRGRLVQTTQLDARVPQGPITTTYGYDAAGSLQTITDTAGNTIVTTYDDLGRKLTVVDPDRGTWTYAWDGLGRLVTQVDARLVKLTMEYDAIGRPLHRFTTGLLDATWTYDQNAQYGVLSKVEGTTTPGYVRTFRYDALLRPYRVTTTVSGGQSRSFATEYGYDNNLGRLKVKRLPSQAGAVGETYTLDYDAQGFLVGETELSTTFVPGQKYRQVAEMSERGQVTNQLLGNCVTESAEYDPSAGLAEDLTVMRPAGATSLPANLGACSPATQLVRKVEYAYDHFLNLNQSKKNMTSGEVRESYGYDALQRLTSTSRYWPAAAPAGTESATYTYDDLGNLTSKSDYATLYEYGRPLLPKGQRGPHAVISASRTDGTTASFLYDDNGNMKSGDGRTFTIDLMDRMVQVVQAGGTTQFAYAPDGSRFWERVDSAGEAFGPRTVYSIDKDYELVVWDSVATGVQERSYIGDSVVVSRTSAGRAVSFVHKDRLGSFDVQTANTAAATEQAGHGFDPWGRPRARDWTSSADRLDADDRTAVTDRGFTGHEHLDAHYLIHMNGRVYDYRLGRFLSVDPIISNPANSQSINPYSYIGNNPLSGTDPTGYTSQPACASYAACSVYNFSGGHVPTVDGTNRAAAYASQRSGALGQSSVIATTNPASAGGPTEVANRPNGTDGVGTLPSAGGTAYKTGLEGTPKILQGVSFTDWQTKMSLALGQDSMTTPLETEAPSWITSNFNEKGNLGGGFNDIPHGDSTCQSMCTHPLHAEKGHPGADVAAPNGTPVLSMRLAVVMKIVAPNPAYPGGAVVVMNLDSIVAIYGHTTALSNLKDGSVLRSGQQLGTVGALNHVHFEVVRWTFGGGWQRLNPIPTLEVLRSQDLSSGP